MRVTSSKIVKLFSYLIVLIVWFVSLSVFTTRVEAVMKVGGSIQKAATEASIELSTPVPSKCGIESLTAEQIKNEPYLANQIMQKVGGAKGSCKVLSLGALKITAEGTGASCPVYKGPSNLGATPTCPSVTISKKRDSKEITILCAPKTDECKAPKQSEIPKENTDEAPCQGVTQNYDIDYNSFVGRIKYYLVASALLAYNGELPCDEDGNVIKTSVGGGTVEGANKAFGGGLDCYKLT